MLVGFLTRVFAKGECVDESKDLHLLRRADARKGPRPVAQSQCLCLVFQHGRRYGRFVAGSASTGRRPAAGRLARPAIRRHAGAQVRPELDLGAIPQARLAALAAVAAGIPFRRAEFPCKLAAIPVPRRSERFRRRSVRREQAHVIRGSQKRGQASAHPDCG